MHDFSLILQHSTCEMSPIADVFGLAGLKCGRYLERVAGYYPRARPRINQNISKHKASGGNKLQPGPAVSPVMSISSDVLQVKMHEGARAHVRSE